MLSPILASHCVRDRCCPCMYVHTHTHMHTYIHTFIHTYIQTNIITCIHTYLSRMCPLGRGSKRKQRRYCTRRTHRECTQCYRVSPCICRRYSLRKAHHRCLYSPGHTHTRGAKRRHLEMSCVEGRRGRIVTQMPMSLLDTLLLGKDGIVPQFAHSQREQTPCALR